MHTFTPRLTALLGAFMVSAISLAALQYQVNTVYGDVNAISGNGDNAGGGFSSSVGGGSFCGDGRVDSEAGEECDDGFSDSAQCTRDCELTEEDDDDTIVPFCGNGVIEGTEQCDDGNDSNSDGCTVRCTISRCGDGMLQKRGRDNKEGTSDDEQCDDGTLNGLGGCTRDCKEARQAEPKCGDGIAEGDEQCDDGNGDDKDFCLPSCKLSFCGDGIVQTVRQEQCDDGNTNDSDKCTNKCREARCGDGIVQSILGEECDEGTQNGGLAIHCSSVCKKRVVDTTVGDGNQDRSIEEAPGEENDDDDVGEQSSSSNTDTDDDGETAAEEALRRQREEQQRMIEERMRQAQAERERLQREQQQSSQGTNRETREEPEPEDVLVCFDADGNVVGDREQCADDQEQFVRPETGISDVEAKEELRKRLLGDNAAEVRRQSLLQTLAAARDKLQSAADSAEMREEVEQYLAEGVAWLNSAIEYFSAGPRNLDEIQQMVPAVRQLLEQSMNIVRQEKQLPVQVNRDFTLILQKTERLLLKFRESFVALSQAGVPLDEGALEQYVTAAELFNEIANVCVQTGERCLEVHQVLEHLKVAQGPLQEAFGENPEMYRAVEEKFAE